jgi:hypothetical protein
MVARSGRGRVGGRGVGEEAAMVETTTGALFDTAGRDVAGSFRRIGRAGFILQLVIGAVPLLVAGFMFFFAPPPSGPRRPLQLDHYLAMASMGLLAFTTIWFFLYARLGRTLAEPGATWTREGLLRRVWIGVAASAAGIVLSTVVMIAETGYMLFRFLEAPQGGVPVIQTDADANWISALDMLSLLALNFTLTAEIAVLILGLLLLYRVTRAATTAPVAAARPAAA